MGDNFMGRDERGDLLDSLGRFCGEGLEVVD
jgi:hypothetical protein